MITNTSKRQEISWLFGGNPGAIEQQEAQGQKELATSNQLPSALSMKEKLSAVPFYDKLGFKTVLEEKQNDTLFVTVEMLPGWQVKPTSHSMWSDLIDPKGNKRGSIFYKAAFYDRDAFIRFNPRYSTDTEYDERTDKGIPNKTIMVKDNQTGAILWTSEVCDFNTEDTWYSKAKDYLKLNYPNYTDDFAYWD